MDGVAVRSNRRLELIGPGDVRTPADPDEDECVPRDERHHRQHEHEEHRCQVDAFFLFLRTASLRF